MKVRVSSGRGFAFRVRQALAVVLAGSMILVGLPIPLKNVVAQVRIEGTTPQLLREQEKVLSDQDCLNLQARIARLSDPRYKENLERPLRQMDNLIRDAEQDIESAKDEARKAGKGALEEIFKLGVGQWNGDQKILKFRIERIRARSIDPLTKSPYRWIQFTKRLETLSDNVPSAALALGNLSLDAPDAVSRTEKALKEVQTFRERAARIASELAESGAPQDVIDLVSLVSPPVALGNSLGTLLVAAGVLTGNVILVHQAKNRLAELKAHQQRMLTEVLRPEIELGNATWRYNKYCKEPPVQQVEKAPEPPSPRAPEPPKAAPKPGGGPGAGGVVAIVGGAAALAAIAAAAGGGLGAGGDGSSGGSSCPACNCGISGGVRITGCTNVGCCPSNTVDVGATSCFPRGPLDCRQCICR